MATEAQVLANRANAQKSTGPREAAGGGVVGWLGDERREGGERVRRSEAQIVSPSYVRTFSASVSPLADGVSTNRPVEDFSCETNPISLGLRRPLTVHPQRSPLEA
jgi:hypothetical protein